MEDRIGELWHKLITRAADNQFPHAQVRLHSLQKQLAIFYRALGGDGGLQIEIADNTRNQARRNWLQRIAGSQTRIQLAWQDQRSLRLPAQISWFDQSKHNRQLYFWLTALASVSYNNPDGHTDKLQHWFVRSQANVITVLDRYPGLQDCYRTLVEQHCRLRPAPDTLPADEAEAERAIRQALQTPGSIDSLNSARFPPQPVPLWLHPDPPVARTRAAREDTDSNRAAVHSAELDDVGTRQAEQVEEPDAERGLITVRMENIFTMGEFVNVDRGSEDEDDQDRAEDVARDLDKLSVSGDGSTSKTRLKFDLDLPSADEDDSIVDDGIMLPEWDWKQNRLLERHCHVVEMLNKTHPAAELPSRLQPTARRVRNQFQALAPARSWQHARQDGLDIDLDAYIRYRSDRRSGVAVSADHLYRELHSGNRDLACLLLADLSLSTDSYIDDRQRVIDVIRDSLHLFAESLSATGDSFSILGFSSRKRDPIRVHIIKQFDEKYNAGIRGRIEAIKPGYYTRLGAGIRYATQKLQTASAKRRLLLVLTDGKPNDLDQYEGRYGIEDTRQAILAARQAGLEPFCVTIDTKGNDYLPYLFGSTSYTVIRRPEQLPRELPRLYALLTR